MTHFEHVNCNWNPNCRSSACWLYQLALSTVLLFSAVAKAEDHERYTVRQVGDNWTIASPSQESIFLVGINHLRDSVPKNQDRAEYFEKAMRNVRSWGINHLGYGTPSELRTEMPFMHEQIYTYGSQFREPSRFEYVDVFDPEFQKQTRERVRAVCEETSRNPNLVGYYWTDTTRWDIDVARRFRGKDWVSSIRQLPAESAGKKAYTEFLRERYQGNTAAYSAAYGHAIASFDDIRQFDFREFDRQNTASRVDDEAFLGRIAETLYGVIGQAYRDFAPDVLVFGERYKLHDHPEVVLRAAVPWIDVVSIQPGPEVGPRPGPGRDEREFDRAAFDRIYELTGKPILICDHRVSFRTEKYPVSLWHQFATQGEAAAAASRFMLDAAKRPYIVGYSHCQYRDQFRPERGNMVKPGFIREDGEPYSEYLTVVTAATAEMKKVHTAKFADQTDRP